MSTQSPASDVLGPSALDDLHQILECIWQELHSTKPLVIDDTNTVDTRNRIARMVLDCAQRDLTPDEMRAEIIRRITTPQAA